MALIIRKNKCLLCERILIHSNIHMPNSECLKGLECNMMRS